MYFTYFYTTNSCTNWCKNDIHHTNHTMTTENALKINLNSKGKQIIKSSHLSSVQKENTVTMSQNTQLGHMKYVYLGRRWTGPPATYTHTSPLSHTAAPKSPFLFTSIGQMLAISYK